MNFFAVKASRTPSIINVTQMSNIDMPGKFVFRVDSTTIKAGGCNVEGIFFNSNINIYNVCFRFCHFTENYDMMFLFSFRPLQVWKRNTFMIYVAVTKRPDLHRRRKIGLCSIFKGLTEDLFLLTANGSDD